MNRRVAAVAAAVIGVSVIAGCEGGGRAPDPHPAPTTTTIATTEQAPPLTRMAPGPTTTAAGCSATQACDGESVIVTGVRALLAYRPSDPDPAGAAADRATAWLCPAYVSSVAGTWAALMPITGTQWSQWAAEHASITPKVSLTSDEHPADTDTTVSRVAQVSVTASTDPTPVTQTMWVIAKTTLPHRWCINNITTGN
ncbi:hypothetical protein [Williamsia sterculiae]|uniref:Uncharacterized protein n=1 Tax=Williamsia sterculiae TaxID=1344003 RepID=A0A1N7HEI4_9NOCA|nr:hypothetical protein [Williamsia sterculiae]SIS23242.1 hypothetical protein SAMN05445060_4081 [Williamsia sterculiae]